MQAAKPAQLCPPLCSMPLNPDALRGTAPPPPAAAEITSEHVVPLDYLLTILLLFLLLVADRVAYSIGSPLGKALLHLG